MDKFSRECLAIHTGQSLKVTDVVIILNELKFFRNIIPKRIQADWLGDFKPYLNQIKNKKVPTFAETLPDGSVTRIGCGLPMRNKLNINIKLTKFVATNSCTNLYKNLICGNLKEQYTS